MATSGRRQFLVGAGSTILGGALTLGAIPSYAQPGTPAPAGGGTTPSGDLITIEPGDGRYAGMTYGSNQRFVASPNEIVLPSNTRAVQTAVETALDNANKIAAPGGGHCYENFVSNDDVKTIVDLKRLNQITFDACRREWFRS